MESDCDCHSKNTLMTNGKSLCCLLSLQTCNIWTFVQDSTDVVRQAEKATAGEAGVRPGGCEVQKGNLSVSEARVLRVIKKALLGGIWFNCVISSCSRKSCTRSTSARASATRTWTRRKTAKIPRRKKKKNPALPKRGCRTKMTSERCLESCFFLFCFVFPF